MAETITPDAEIREMIMLMGGEEAYKCYQCGKCTAACPWFQLSSIDFLVHKFSQEAKLGTLDTEGSDIWLCVSCEACRAMCPRGLDTPIVMRAVRRILAEYGALPDTLQVAASSISSSGNPFGSAPDKRAEWAQGLDIPVFNGTQEYLYFPCCTPAFDPRIMKVARATAQVLHNAGISFGILGERERCCGEAIRRAGAEEVFTETAGQNITLFKEVGVKKILVTSPHCLCTFRDEYPELGGEFEALHTSVLFARLVSDGTLKPQKELSRRVVYHDPCALGRRSGIYDEPRRVLLSIPGLELVEVDEFSREFSVCCGGGGGGVWLELPSEQRLSNHRLKQLVATGADTIAVACPYCLQMFADSIKTTEADIELNDVSELLAQSLGL